MPVTFFLQLINMLVIESFYLQFDLHLFLKSATVAGRIKFSDLLYQSPLLSLAKLNPANYFTQLPLLLFAELNLVDHFSQSPLLLFAELNLVDHFTQSPLLLAKSNEHRTACRNSLLIMALMMAV